MCRLTRTSSMTRPTTIGVNLLKLFDSPFEPMNGLLVTTSCCPKSFDEPLIVDSRGGLYRKGPLVSRTVSCR